MECFQKIIIFLLSVNLGADAIMQRIGLKNFFSPDNLLVELGLECVRLPKVFTQGTDAVINYHECIRLFESHDCTGNFLQLPSSIQSYKHLDFWHLPDESSVSICPFSCFAHSQNTSDVLMINVTLFSQKNYKGYKQELTFNKCTSVHPTFFNMTTSIQTKGNCVQLYNKENCRMDDPDSLKLELMPGQPYHDDLSGWGMPIVKSVSPCTPNCTLGTLTFEPGPLKDELYLFELQNFGGLALRINVSSGECIPLSFYWKERAQSLIIGERTCVTLFEQASCRGNEYDINFSVINLPRLKINWTAASLQSCVWTGATIELNRSKPINQPSSGNFNKTTKNANKNYFSTSPHFIWVNVLALLFGVSLVVLATLFVFKKCHTFGILMEKLSDKEVQDFLSGFELEILSASDNANNDNANEMLAQQMPYNKEFEISLSRITFDSSITLGMGEFGVIHKGILTQSIETETGSRENMVVAIKTVKPSSGAHGLRSLLKEVKVMQYLGSHDNLAKFIGCCTEKLKQGEIFLVMEYYSEGSLKTFLRKNSLSFENLVENGEIRLNKQYESQSGNRLPFEKETYVNVRAKFDTLLLVKWCIEIAQGMEFLTNRKVVHSDLATRNVLLTDMLQAKISDFGLSRKLYEYSQYKKESKEPLPWRWMAIESLKFSVFSTKSDVWSYGVLCWEIFSLGREPYFGQQWTNDFLANLENGMRLEKPENSSNEFYNLMQCCWEFKSDARPTFTEISNGIEEMFTVSTALD